MIGTDCIGSKSNYHTITTMTAPRSNMEINETNYE